MFASCDRPSQAAAGDHLPIAPKNIFASNATPKWQLPIDLRGIAGHCETKVGTGLRKVVVEGWRLLKVHDDEVGLHERMSAGLGTVEGRKRGRMVLRAVAGASFEYFDYVIFAVFAPFYSQQFFPSSNPTAAMLKTLMIFALGFIMRPLGAIIAGQLADRFGRKPVMMLSLALAALGSLVVAITPTYATFGLGSVVLLVGARLLQGLGHGMESISAYIYTAEMAHPKRRALYSCAYPIALNLGVLEASAFGVVLTSLLSNEAMYSWGWRIPFFVGAAYGLFVAFLRRGMEEPPSYEEGKSVKHQSDEDGYWTIVWKHRKIIICLLLLWAAASTGTYTLQVGYSEYAISILHANPRDAFWAAFIAQFLYMFAMVFWANISDRRGRKFNYYVGLGGTIALAFPMQYLLGPSFWMLVIPMSLSLFIWSAESSTELAFINEQIPNRVRAQVMSLPSSLGTTIFGGTAPYLRSWCATYLDPSVFTFYFIFLCIIALIVISRLPETAGKSLSE